MRNTLALAFSLTLLAAVANAATTPAPAAAPAAKPAPAATAPAAAPAAKPAATPAKPATHPAASATGDVTAFDATKHVLTIKADGKDLTIQIGKSTHLSHADGKAATTADLKAGAHVTVTYGMHGTEMVAKSVKIS